MAVYPVYLLNVKISSICHNISFNLGWLWRLPSPILVTGKLCLKLGLMAWFIISSCILFRMVSPDRLNFNQLVVVWQFGVDIILGFRPTNQNVFEYFSGKIQASFIWPYQPYVHTRSNFNAERTRRKIKISTIFMATMNKIISFTYIIINLLQKKLKKRF